MSVDVLRRDDMATAIRNAIEGETGEPFSYALALAAGDAVLLKVARLLAIEDAAADVVTCWSLPDATAQNDEIARRAERLRSLIAGES